MTFAFARTYLILFLLLSLGACTPEDLEVTYLYVEQVNVVGPDNREAAAAPGVVGVRAVRGATSLGIYPLPAKIPVLNPSDGPDEVRLEAVVRRAGIADNLTVYPYYTAATVPLAFTRGETDTLDLTLSYTDAVKIALLEDFHKEPIKIGVALRDNVNSGFSRQEESSQGDTYYFGRAILSSADSVLSVASEVVKPAAVAQDVWLELEYRGTGVLAVALLPSQTDYISLAGFFNQGALPRTDWQKFYFPLRNEISRNYLDAFRLGLRAQHNPNSTAPDTIEIRDLRLLYR